MTPRSLTLGALALLTLTGNVHAAGTVAAEFLRFAIGAPAGMSEASGAIQQETSSLYWNPAGLAGLDRAQVYASHNSLPMTLRHDVLALAIPVSWVSSRVVLGYTVQALTQSEIEKLTNTGASAGSYNATDMAHTLGAATQWEAWRAGLSLRYIRQTLDGTSGSAMALGGGVQRDIGDHWDAGIAVANLGPDLKLGSESAPLPRTVRAGVGLHLLEKDLLLAGDVSQVQSIGTRGHLGAQYRIYPPRPSADKGSVSVRGGYTFGAHRDDAYSGAAWGLSLSFLSLRADFSYQPFGDLGNSLQLGLGYRF